jgi:hypothetical protein
MQQASAAYKPRLWVPGDWNAFFGLFTNVILNVIVLTGLTLGVVQLAATKRRTRQGPPPITRIRSTRRSTSATGHSASRTSGQT